MIAKVYSAIPHGYHGSIVEVEGDTNQGLPAFNIVGMANKTISEARERVRSSIMNSGFTFPARKITINLAPAELAKDGAHLDLPIALAILILAEQLPSDCLKNTLTVGELSLDGQTKPIRGIINILETAKQTGYSTVFLPTANLPQATLVKGLEIIGVDSLLALFLHLKGVKKLPASTHQTSPPASPQNLSTDRLQSTNSTSSPPNVLLDHIHGQPIAKRALEIAVAGHHNLLLSGPPGSGKTLLARAATSLLPPPSPAEQIEITKIYSLFDAETAIHSTRPFRAPHHTASPVAIVGGGPKVLPGEISLAHRGILFLDELPEYPTSVLESLRQPLEDGTISISRASHRVTYPANFMLIATMNPCPCGFLGDPDHACTCPTHLIKNYQKRLSGPILDRIDMTVTVNRVASSDLLDTPLASPSASETNVAKSRIQVATRLQAIRYPRPGQSNASLSSADIAQHLHLHPDAKSLLLAAGEKLKLSARAHFKVIRVAQTIADLDAAQSLLKDPAQSLPKDTPPDLHKNSTPEILPAHISEALSFRQPIFPSR